MGIIREIGLSHRSSASSTPNHCSQKHFAHCLLRHAYPCNALRVLRSPSRSLQLLPLRSGSSCILQRTAIRLLTPTTLRRLESHSSPLHATHCFIIVRACDAPACVRATLAQALLIASLCLQRNAHCAAITPCSRFPRCPNQWHSQPPLVVPPVGGLTACGAGDSAVQWCGTAWLLLAAGAFPQEL